MHTRTHTDPALHAVLQGIMVLSGEATWIVVGRGGFRGFAGRANGGPAQVSRIRSPRRRRSCAEPRIGLQPARAGFGGGRRLGGAARGAMAADRAEADIMFIQHLYMMCNR